jgi:diguanylate cyclase (GGDEF)-like protein
MTLEHNEDRETSPARRSTAAPRRRGLSLWVKISAGVAAPAILVAIGGFGMADSASHLRDEFDRVIQADNSLVAAAFEMEINTIGFGLGVLTHVQTDDPVGIERMADDRADFYRFRDIYDQNAVTDIEREFSVEATNLFGEFERLGTTLVAESDLYDTRLATYVTTAARFESAYGARDELTDAIERSIHQFADPSDNSDTAQMLLVELDQLTDASATSPPIKAAAAELIVANDAILATHATLSMGLATFIELRDRLDVLLDERIQVIANARLNDSSQAASSRADNVRRALLLGGIIAAIAAAASSWVVTRMVRRPIDSLAAAMRSVRMGDLDHRIDSTRNDELGDLSRDVDATTELLQRTTVSVQELQASQAELNRAHEMLAHRAMFDSLTGLPNRVNVVEQLTLSLQRRSGTDRSLAILYVDLDRFKFVNDTLGHAAGDELLVEASRRLTASVRSCDRVARLGGDEFVVVCDEFGDDAAQDELDRVALRVLQAFEGDFFLSCGEVFVSASIGIAIADDDHDADSLLSDADVALYRAKQAGRAVARYFEPTMRTQTEQRHRVEIELGRAIDDGDLRVLFQPIVHLPDSSLAGFEALVRWEHPEHGLLTPDRFIPLAEESSLVERIDEWVFESVCTQLVEWAATGDVPTLGVSVNVSGRHLSRPGYVDKVLSCIERHGLDATLITLEVTETALLEDPDRARLVLESLRSAGLRIGIDDFGTGYSSLSYLQQFSFDVLKIDRSFVAEVTTSPRSAAIVEASIALAHSLGYQVVAEGVENPGHLSILTDLGCELAQGYHFSPPVTSAVATSMLRGKLAWTAAVGGTESTDATRREPAMR